MSNLVTLSMSRAAATFLRGMVNHINDEKILPADNQQALQTSAWLEEIAASADTALTQEAKR